MNNQQNLIEVELLMMTYTRQGQKITLDCNSIQFKNDGGSTLLINNVYQLKAGEVLTISGNMFEVMTGQLTITFAASDVTAGTALLSVIKKVYRNPGISFANFNKMVSGGK